MEGADQPLAEQVLMACASGDLVLVERAWRAWPEHERDVDVRGGTGRTPLHLAASCGSTAVVEWLLERGAGRELRDAIGWTAVHHAANSGTVSQRMRSGHSGSQFLTAPALAPVPPARRSLSVPTRYVPSNSQRMCLPQAV